MSDETTKAERQDGSVLMQVTKQGGFGNTTLIGGITIRRVATLVIAIFLGYLLWNTPLFNKNVMALAAYAAFASICLGQTPTGRNLLTNLYGIVFKKQVNMIVTSDMTTTTTGHGISEVVLTEQELDVIPFRMVGTKNYAMVYNITSGINRWSTEDEKVIQARRVKSLYNILEGGEALMIVEKQDNDTGMLKLKDALEAKQKFEGNDLAQMAKKRSQLLHDAGTSDAGRSIQQYAILLVKPKNVNRTINEVKKLSRITRPATNPMDILLSCMGFEGGVEWMRAEKEHEYFQDTDESITSKPKKTKVKKKGANDNGLQKEKKQRR